MMVYEVVPEEDIDTYETIFERKFYGHDVWIVDREKHIYITEIGKLGPETPHFFYIYFENIRFLFSLYDLGEPWKKIAVYMPKEMKTYTEEEMGAFTKEVEEILSEVCPVLNRNDRWFPASIEGYEIDYDVTNLEKSFPHWFYSDNADDDIDDTQTNAVFEVHVGYKEPATDEKPAVHEKHGTSCWKTFVFVGIIYWICSWIAFKLSYKEEIFIIFLLPLIVVCVGFSIFCTIEDIKNGFKLSAIGCALGAILQGLTGYYYLTNIVSAIIKVI